MNVDPKRRRNDETVVAFEMHTKIEVRLLFSQC